MIVEVRTIELHYDNGKATSMTVSYHMTDEERTVSLDGRFVIPSDEHSTIKELEEKVKQHAMEKLNF